MKTFFTSDTHFGEPYERFHLFGRDKIFHSAEDFEQTMIGNWNQTISKKDTVYILGDFAVNEDALARVAPQLNGTKILIKGNYDDQFSDDLLKEFFDEVHECKHIKIESDNEVDRIYLNHYPNKGTNSAFNLVGHIHGLWKVQRNMINVGVDAWHFLPVTEDEIRNTINAIKKFYDENVFAGELRTNISRKQEDKVVIYPGMNNYFTDEKSIFLAGPIMGSLNWRKNLIYRLNKIDKDFFISNPQKIQKPEDYDMPKQVLWENEHMNIAARKGVLIFWFANQETEREEGQFAQTSRFELGEFLYLSKHAQHVKIIVGLDTEFKDEDYIKFKCAEAEVPVVYSFDEMIEKIEEIL